MHCRRPYPMGLIILLMTASPALAQSELAKTLESRLTAQVEAWNRGDIDTFMLVYWHSEQLAFSSGGKTTKGWQATLDRYKSRYPDRESMGRLTFDQLVFQPLGRNAAYVLGNWKLTRDADTPRGNFTLVFRKIDGQWVIVHDHTSLRPENSDQ